MLNFIVNHGMQIKTRGGILFYVTRLAKINNSDNTLDEEQNTIDGRLIRTLGKIGHYLEKQNMPNCTTTQESRSAPPEKFFCMSSRRPARGFPS